MQLLSMRDFLQIYKKFPYWENVVQIRIDEAI